MFRKAIVLTVALMTIGLSACVSEDKPGEPAASTPAPPENIVFDRGFFGLERDANMSWRWMEPEGIVKLKNTGKDMVLKLSGRAPVEHFKEPPLITISFGGIELDKVTSTPAIFDREFTITAAQQGKGEWSELRIASDKSFVPKEVDPGGTDPRRLAFSLTRLSWEVK